MGSKTTTIKKVYHRKTVSYFGDTTVNTQYVDNIAFRNGVNLPNFKELIARGVDATTPFTGTRQWTIFYPSSFLVGIKGSEMVAYDESHHPTPLALTSGISGMSLADASNDAAIRIRKKIRDEVTSFSGMTFLGELAESVKMIRKPGQALADKVNKTAENLVRAKRKAKLYNTNSLSKTVGDTWLEGVFGWAPLINDIRDIAEASLQRFNRAEINRVFAVGKGEESRNAERYISSNNYVEYWVDEQWTDKTEVRWIVGVKNEVSRSNNGLERVIERSGLDSWREIVPAAWELLPWSFLLDYFGNIGDVLTAATVSLNNVAWANRTERRSISFSRKGKTPGLTRTDYYVLLQSNPGFDRSTYTTVTRGSGVIPLPELRFEMPGSRQGLNIAALLASRLKSI